MSFARSRHVLATILALMVALSGPATARAASPADRVAARQHLRQADELKQQGRIAEACGHLQEVERLDPKLPTLIALAECSELAGDWVAAEEQWERARDRAKRDEKPQSRAKAESRLAAAHNRVARVTLQLAPGATGAQVFGDGVALEPASIGAPLPINPGAHVFVVKLAGHDDAQYPLKLADGEAQTLTLAAGPTPTTAAAAVVLPVAAAAAPPPPPAAVPPTSLVPPKVDAPAPSGWWSTEHKAGVWLGGLGLVAAGTGTALCVVANGDKTNVSAVDGRLALGGISIAVGGVLVVSSLVLLASTPEAAQRARSRVAPTLLVARNAAVVGAITEF